MLLSETPFQKIIQIYGENLLHNNLKFNALSENSRYKISS